MGQKFSGKDGSVTFASGYDDHVTGWTMDISTDILDCTDFDSAAKENVFGHYGWSGSYDAWMDDTTPVAGAGSFSPQTGSSTFLAITGRTFGGTIRVGGIGVSVPVGDMASASFDYTGTGVVTIA